MKWLKSVWQFIKDCVDSLSEEDKQLRFDFEKEKRRWHDYLHRPPSRC